MRVRPLTLGVVNFRRGFRGYSAATNASRAANRARYMKFQVMRGDVMLAEAQTREDAERAALKFPGSIVVTKA